MCGRFTLTTPAEALVELLGLAEAPALVARYNIAPTQPIAAVGRRGADAPRRLSQLHWGFRPGGANGPLLINARSETVARTAAFRDAFRSRRCLIPADGFYEWKREAGRKQAYHLARVDARPFAFAGLWQSNPGQHPSSAAVILTTEPNELLRGIHDRMPVILPSEAFTPWLDPELDDPGLLQRWLTPASAEGYVATPVGPHVNNARNDDPACLAPALTAGD